MIKGICTYPLVACRREPNERSEMISQLLYGEAYEIIEEQASWIKIKNLRDSYESWIDIKLHSSFSGTGMAHFIAREAFNEITDASGKKMIVPGASIIHSKEKMDPSPESLIDTALKFLGAPYLWGGKSIWGLDCSGFVQVVYQIHGIDLQRDAYQQAESGEIVEFNDLIEAGDLAFFSKENERISHVGICISKEQIIHASGEVRIDKLDHHGIFNQENQTYSHQLRIVKRIKKAVEL
jgi:hypothetical protein